MRRWLTAAVLSLGLAAGSASSAHGAPAPSPYDVMSAGCGSLAVGAYGSATSARFCTASDHDRPQGQPDPLGPVS